jgi:signal transduction histidine kinase
VRHEHKILLALVLAAVLPAGLAGTLAMSATRRGIEAQSSDLLVSLAREAAGFVEHEIARSAESAASVLSVARGGVARFTPEQREAFLSVVYHLFEGHSAVALVDPAGVEPVQQLRRRPEDRAGALGRHPASTDEDAARFVARIPVAEAAEGGRAISPAYLASAGDPRVVVAVRADSPGEKRLVLAVEVSLAGVGRHLGDLLPREGGAVLARADGSPLLVVGLARPHETLSGPERSPGSGLEPLRLEDRSGPLALAGGRLGATVWLAGPRAAVVVWQSARAALEPSRAIFRQALAWLAGSLVVALVLAFVLSRGLAAPVRALAGAARRIGGGALGERVDLAARGELGLLAQAFNEMSAELRRKQDEIEAWNRELQARVDRKTEELKKLQQVAARAQRAAALAGLSAGLAHEINNPLMAVLGHAQLLRRDVPPGPLAERLGTLEREARRIAEVVQALMHYGEGAAEEGEAIEMEIDAVLDSAWQVVSAAHPSRRPEASRTRAPGATVRGIAGELRQALAHVLDNAVEATEESQPARVEIAAEEVEGVVRVTIRDFGRGIPREHLERVFDPFFTTKRSWQGKGLGLSVALRVIAAHGGEIAIDSEAGRGTTVRITLPRAQRASLLD